MIIFSGGSSVGERDLIVDVVAARGEMIFHGIAVKPGKPTAFAMIGGTPFFGMPGNPTSCLSNAYILLVAISARDRAPAAVSRRTPSGRPSARASSRRQGVISSTPFACARAPRIPAFKGSGEITSLSQADGYIEIPADQSTIEAGTIVEVTLF